MSSYINKGWYTEVPMFKMCPDLKTLVINCKPFNAPMESSSFTLVGVYGPPQAALMEITDEEKILPDSLLIILGDFNRANLKHKLQNYRQHINCPTRDTSTLHYCFNRSVPVATHCRT